MALQNLNKHAFHFGMFCVYVDSARASRVRLPTNRYRRVCFCRTGYSATRRPPAAVYGSEQNNVKSVDSLFKYTGRQSNITYTNIKETFILSIIKITIFIIALASHAHNQTNTLLVKPVAHYIDVVWPRSVCNNVVETRCFYEFTSSLLVDSGAWCFLARLRLTHYFGCCKNNISHLITFSII